ncbi:helix-turn-helix domain-containing protein [Bacteroides sp. 51]|uniref:helix-turn-helix domain-containing protein n=1 Tax=Bacteroides sp. 51 TaxID=2302938 RepID=UPI0013D09B0C|nr:helix-turn-helix domain-containing protein [Bacteroides sp. 51]NDV84548.1 DNA-binding protein [Bacteroides sp. 51]
MADMILTSKDELMEIVREAISQAMAHPEKSKPIVDTLNMEGVLELLAENGYQTSKAQIYKFTSQKLMPFMKIGNKLLFSRKEVLGWMKDASIRGKTRDDALKVIQASQKKGG